ncbi:cellulose biosynthesis cyclic di-GMP-binding regulatory protein BcsB [Acuticoccus sp. MNP-M23]|uniref:cellulose biosynthesis cyclic di-GMP-binding regulatory protein BcsB n=1 Tax=Acuticoccus sp. MNP-M23 TaxID=3072793 RepID=UPI002814B799|nr:cellulose biosynthesis cyclic di-GMP-binding regulatory protein BcsB [Acuticoccus sp. MNP-M23]WMS43699.1 cellulose biosynthesis cyclic di-GMP-binding regulatory protein BcsB [Acuticoccus sp. MNP-M23]
MRKSLLGTAVIALGLMAPGLAGAQVAPFQIRGNEGGPNLPGSASPSRLQNLAADEAREISPDSPGIRTNAPPGTPLSAQPAATVNAQQGNRALRSTPAPFDINQDGTSPVLVIPEEEEEIFQQSTTESPLSNGQGLGLVVPVDAVNQEQRSNLNRLLKEEGDQVRELRVNVENSEAWVDSVVDRPIVPDRTLRLDGEIDYASWGFYLSATEAARGGTLSIAFTNSVLVLPEASRMRVYLNGRELAQTAIDSPDRTKVIALPISPELLRAGENALRIETEMRHRIDCSLDATYELWTRIDTRLTGFTYPGGRAPLAGLGDLPGVGVGTNGATRIRVFQAAPASATNIDRMLRAVQAASVRGRYVQPLVEVVDLSAKPESAQGTLTVMIGTYEQLRRISEDIPPEAGVGPFATLIDPSRLGPTLLISGPNERAVDTALARLDVTEGSGAPRSPIAATPPWLVPDSVPIDGAGTVSLRKAGVETINFSGRRFVTDFQVTLPPDFYAAAYGEARLLLDAAYSGDVNPGSRLSVFVNGVLSTAISFTSSSGEVFDDFPIVLVMKQFRPGINKIEIVADLNTDSDAACLPGGTVPARDRFALFSSTRLVFPSFARIGQLPNLASFATNGFPYTLTDAPVRVRVGGTSLDTIGAAGTLLARVAVSRGAPLATNVVENVGEFADAGAIVVAPLEEVSNIALEATGASSVIPANWLQPSQRGGSVTGEPEGLERYDEVLRRLRQQLRQEEVRLDRDAAESDEDTTRGSLARDQRNETERSRDRWFEELQGSSGITGMIKDGIAYVRNAINLNIDFSRDDGIDEVDVTPIPDSATFLMAQSASPENADTAWTLITAPSAGLLSASTAAITSPDQWRQIGGRITAYDLENNRVNTIAAENVSYLATLPLSFSNIRLIAANWFSLNNGIYSIALILIAMVLGVVTFLLVTPLGRKS